MQSLSIVSVYNRYLNRGGEDEVFESEAKLLSQFGCSVRLVTEQTEAPNNICEKVGLAVECAWSSKWHKRFKALLKQARPDVVHVHNVFPVMSPSIYYACREANIPVVQTLHNYRLVCPAATFYRDGQVCEDCVEHGLGRSVVHGCYQQSRSGTAAIALMLQLHRKMNTWTQTIDRYIALTDFAREKFVAAGLPDDKFRVKPNFIDPDPGQSGCTREYAIFVGRLVHWKGIRTILSAWKSLPIPLTIVGDGPLQSDVADAITQGLLSAVSYRGRLPREETIAAMKRARFLVFPSQWYEGFPMTIVEAFACSVPVICAGLGSMKEIVADGRTGLHFEAGNAEDLAAKVRWAWAHPKEMEVMGRQARAEYEAKYTAKRNGEMLIDIYRDAIAARA